METPQISVREKTYIGAATQARQVRLIGLNDIPYREERRRMAAGVLQTFQVTRGDIKIVYERIIATNCS